MSECERPSSFATWVGKQQEVLGPPAEMAQSPEIGAERILALPVPALRNVDRVSADVARMNELSL